MPQTAIASEEIIKIAVAQTEDDWQLEPVKACLISNPDCEACQ